MNKATAQAERGKENIAGTKPGSKTSKPVGSMAGTKEFYFKKTPKT
jgi:hypothetical protein